MEESEANSFRNVEEKSNFTCKNANLDEAKKAPKEVDFSQFSCLKREIEEVEKIIKNMDAKQFQLYKEIKEKKLKIESEKPRLEYLMHQERMYRQNLAWKIQILDPLKSALLKKSFSNNIAIKSPIFDEQHKIDFNKFNIKMLHGKKKNMEEEKRLVKEIYRRQETIAIVSSTNRTMGNLSLEISRPLSRRHFDQDEDWHKRNLEKIEQLKQKREKVIANAVVRQKVWDSLGSKKAIQQKINLVEKEFEELRKKMLATRAEIKQIEKKLLATEKEIDLLHSQNKSVYKKKDQAYKSRYLLLKIQEKNDKFSSL